MPEKAGKMRGGTDCRIFDFRDQLEWQRYCLTDGGAIRASTHDLHGYPRRKMRAKGIIEMKTRLGGCINIEMVLKNLT